MNHQKLLLVVIRIGLISTISVLGWNFPLQQVANPACRGQTREELSDACKIDMLKEGKQPENSKALFSALWGATYSDPQEVKNGGHPSLDIATVAGTPVYAIQDGTVVKAGEIAGYGNSITIKHTIEGKTIYSNYSHLRDILVKVNDIIKSGTLIGRVGCSGFTIGGTAGSCGYHLDFQITTDKSPSHPYGYHDCPGGYYAAVESGLCRDKLLAYTIDPLVFFNTYTSIDLRLPLVEEISPVNIVKIISEKEKIIPKRPTLQEIYARLRQQNQHIISDNTQSDRLPQETTTDLIQSLATSVQVPTTPTKVIDQAPRTSKFNDYTIKWSWNSDPLLLEKNRIITLTIEMTDSFDNPITDTLPSPFSVKGVDAQVGVFFPSTFSNIIDGKKHIFFQTKQSGKAELSLWIGENLLGKDPIVIR